MVRHVRFLAFRTQQARVAGAHRLGKLELPNISATTITDVGLDEASLPERSAVGKISADNPLLN